MSNSYSPITHHMSKVDGSNMYAVTRVTPTIRMAVYGESVLLQNGRVWDDAGKELKPDDYPGWLYTEMGKLTPAALREAGFECSLKPQGAVEESRIPPTTMGTASWQCPDCSKVMDERSKEAHIAKHNRRRAPDNQLSA